MRFFTPSNGDHVLLRPAPRAYDKYIRKWGAEIDFPTFVRLYGHRHEDRRIKIPRAIDRLFANPKTDDERAIKALIELHDAAEATRLEIELFAQKTRLNTAARALETKVTKKAQEDVRIATNKIDRDSKLADLRREDVKRAIGDSSPLVCACASQRRGRPQVGPHALPVPPCGQAVVLRHQVPRHVQRAQGQPGALLEGHVRFLPRAHHRRHVLRERRGAGRKEPSPPVHTARSRAALHRVPVVALDKSQGRRARAFVLRRHHG